MKTRERSGAKAGAYVAVFDALVRSGNKVGLKANDKGERVMFRLKSIKGGEEIPYSVRWNFTEPALKSIMGLLGVPWEVIKKSADEEGIETALLKFEKMAKAKALPVSTYVREDAGWGSAIKPFTEGPAVFTVRFAGIKTFDEEGNPAYKHIEEKRRSKRTGGTYEINENRFSVWLEILTGERKGGMLDYMMHYAIVQDADGDWVIDAETRRGAEFNNFLLLHKIPVGKLNPDKDFANPANGLPELQQMMLSKAMPFSVFYENGWVGKISKFEGEIVLPDSQPKQVDEGSEYKSTKIAKLFSAIDQTVRNLETNEEGKSAFTPDGKFTPVGKVWVKEYLLPFMKKREMPTNFKELDDAQVTLLMKKIAKLQETEAEADTE